MARLCADRVVDKILICIGQIKKKERNNNYYSNIYTGPQWIMPPFHFKCKYAGSFKSW